MAAGYRLIGKNKLIPRPTYPGRKRAFIKTDLDNPYENEGTDVSYVLFDVLECVVQPMTGKAARDYTAQLMSEGGKEYDSFTVYSTTPLRGTQEATTDLADQIQLPDSRGDLTWFTVIKSDIYSSSGVPRYRHFVVAVPEGTQGGL